MQNKAGYRTAANGFCFVAFMGSELGVTILLGFF